MAKTHHQNWFIAKDGNKLVVRRHVYKADGTKGSERYPALKYAHLSTKRELEDFVIRLNGKDPTVERIKAKLSFKHAYISPELMDDYRENYLYQQIPTLKDAQSMYGYLDKYALNFFIEKLGLKNPLEWHRHQNVWGRYLLNKGELETNKLIFEPNEIKSAKLIRMTVNELNRFMKYLHLKRPDEVAALTFDPISKAAYKEHEARRKLDNNLRASKYIKADHWAKIEDYLEKNQVKWRFFVYLAKSYGLRRNEVLGLQLTDVRKAHIAVDRQFEKLIENEINYKPLKNRQPRKVPHWLITPGKAHSWINEIPNSILHPDTISAQFKELMSKLELPDYVFHDLRRTFITDAIKKGIEPEDLRLAAGHANIQTTYKFYVMDSRDLEDDIFIPDDQAS